MTKRLPRKIKKRYKSMVKFFEIRKQERDAENEKIFAQKVAVRACEIMGYSPDDIEKAEIIGSRVNVFINIKDGIEKLEISRVWRLD